MTSAKLNKIYTEFVFFKASHDESTVGVVYSFPAGTMGDGAEYPGWIPCGAKLDKTRTKFVFFKASPDESTVEVVSSFPAGTASPWAGYGQGWATVRDRGLVTVAVAVAGKRKDKDGRK